MKDLVNFLVLCYISSFDSDEAMSDTLAARHEKDKVKSLIIRNEQLALEILRVRSKYAKLKKEFNAMKALLLVSKMPAATQTSVLDWQDASYDSIIVTSSGGGRRDLKHTYQSPRHCNFDRSRRGNTEKATELLSTPARKAAPQSTPRKPPRTRSSTKSSSKMPSGDVVRTPQRLSSNTKYRPFSNRDHTGVEVVLSPEGDESVVHGEKLLFEGEKATEGGGGEEDTIGISPVQEAWGPPSQTVTPGRTVKAMRRADRFTLEEVQLQFPSRAARRVRTPVSYREPSLAAKIRKGHKFFEFE